MRRRQVLTTVGAATTYGVVGCTGAVFEPALTERWTIAFDQRPTSPTVVDDTIYVTGGEDVIARAITPSGDEAWGFDLTERDSRGTSPTVVDDTLYVAASGSQSKPSVVVGIEADDGNEVWQFEMTASWISSSPAVAGNRIYLASSDAFHGIDATTGIEQWRFEPPRGMSRSSAVVVDSTLYIGGGNETFYAIDIDSGEPTWTFHAEDVINMLSPTYSDGIIFTGSADHCIYAIDAESGDTIWKYDTGSAVFMTPTVWHDIVYVGNQDGQLYALDARSGDERWRTSDFDIPPLSTPTVVEGRLYAFNGRVDCVLSDLDAETGTIERELAIEGHPVGSSPVVVDGMLYVGTMIRKSHRDSFGLLYAIDVGTGGSSSDSRVMLGTHGHHHGWTDEQPEV